jgi:hypothetical protein
VDGGEQAASGQDCRPGRGRAAQHEAPAVPLPGTQPDRVDVGRERLTRHELAQLATELGFLK